MNVSRARDAMAETCGKLWAVQGQQQTPLAFQELTPLETQALVFAVIDGRAGVEVAEAEVDRVLEAAAKAKRMWRRLQAAMLGQAKLRFNGSEMQLVTPAEPYEDGEHRMPIANASELVSACANQPTSRSLQRR